VLNPHLPTTMIWDEGCRQILVKVEREALQDHLSQLLGSGAGKPLTFSGPLDLTSDVGAALYGLIMHLVTEADNGQVMLSSGGLLARQLESVILSGILEAGQHNYSRYLRPTRSAAAPRHVRKAEEFVRSNLDNPISLDDIANAAGVTPRSLQLGFRNFRNTSPMALLRSERLRRVHEELMAGAPGDLGNRSGDPLGLFASRPVFADLQGKIRSVAEQDPAERRPGSAFPTRIENGPRRIEERAVCMSCLQFMPGVKPGSVDVAVPTGDGLDLKELIKPQTPPSRARPDAFVPPKGANRRRAT
jgi:AraC-like DNA-binding protein